MAEFQAGGTDVQDRRRRGTLRGALSTIRPTADLDRIVWHDNCATIGALVRVATVASDPRLKAAYPGLAAAAGGLATPQIRAVATVGGALLQRTRCWYYRDPAVSCFKKGGDHCPARDGDHTFGVCFDLGPCVWPHPSTLGAALLAHEASVVSEPGGVRPIAELFGNGSDPSHDHQLPDGHLLTAVTLGTPVAGEQSSYLRVIGRAFAEWPLVEVVVRFTVDRGRISFARIAVGGVAPVPLRLLDLEQALIGADASPKTIEHAAENGVRALQATIPTLESTRFKLALIPVAIADAAANALTPGADSPRTFQPPWVLPWIT